MVKINILGKIKNKLKRAFGAKPRPQPQPPPKPNTKVVGHRGIAAGSLKKRRELNERFLAGEAVQPYTAEEIARWHNLSGDEVQDFVENEQPLFVNSSNVVLVQYF